LIPHHPGRAPAYGSDSSLLGSPPPKRTSVRWSVRLAARQRAGSARRRLAGSLFPLPAIFLDAQQGTFEKIQFQCLARHQTLQFRYSPALPLVILFLPPGFWPSYRLAAEALVSPPVYLTPGSPQEFVRSGILRGLPVFLKSDVFGVGHHHALGFQ
jgi:hypothetical protein